MKRFGLNNDTGIASEMMDTRFQKNRNVCGNRILRTWRECKTKTILWIEKRISMKRFKRHKEILRFPNRSRRVFSPSVVHSG